MAPAMGLMVAFAASATTKTNKIDIKFNRMIDELKLPPTTIEFIDSPKQRVLFRGVAAGVQEPLVRNAFSIVYKDLAPVRVAGDLIFSQLSSVATDASERASGITSQIDDDDVATKNTTGENESVDATSLAASRRIFDLLDGDGSGGLDRSELLTSPEMMDLVRKGFGEDGNESDDETAVDRFMDLADENGDGVVSFVEFVNAVAIRPEFGLVDDALSAALLSPSVTEAGGTQKKKRGTFGRKLPEDRFEEMVVQCKDWEIELGCSVDSDALGGLVDSEDEECVVNVEVDKGSDKEDDRLLQVLTGALVGSRCEPVVDALKMCYLDYSPLRLGGDIIYKLLKRVVATQIRKKNT